MYLYNRSGSGLTVEAENSLGLDKLILLWSRATYSLGWHRTGDAVTVSQGGAGGSGYLYFQNPPPRYFHSGIGTIQYYDTQYGKCQTSAIKLGMNTIISDRYPR